MIKRLIMLPLVLLSTTSCGQTLIDQATDSINANSCAIQRSTEVIRENKRIIEESNRVIDENHRLIEKMSKS